MIFFDLLVIDLIKIFMDIEWLDRNFVVFCGE